MVSSNKIRSSYFPVTFSILSLVSIAGLYFFQNSFSFIHTTREGIFFTEVFPMIALVLAATSVVVSFLYIQRERRYFSNYIQQKNQENDRVIKVLTQISADNYRILDNISDDHLPVVKALKLMQNRFEAIDSEEQKRNWHIQGISILSDVIRSHSTIENLSTDFIKSLAKYIKCEQGCVFVLDESQNKTKDNSDSIHSENNQLVISGYYVSEDVKPLKSEIQYGQGLIGQILKDKQTVLLKEVPENYIKINSGLGSSSPSEILLVPILFENKILGLIELASFSPFSQEIISFVEEISSKISVTLFNLQTAAKNLAMLRESQQLTIELKERETALLISDRELQASQKQMDRIMQNVIDVIFQLKSTFDSKKQVVLKFEFISNRILDLLGIQNNDIISNFDTFEINKEDKKNWEAAIAQSIRNDSDLFWEGRVKNILTNQFIWVKITASCESEGTDFIWNGTISDITLRKQTEEEMRIRDRAISSASNGIVITDLLQPDRPVVYANAAYYQITGYSPEDIIGKNRRILQGKDQDQPGVFEIRNAINEGIECQVLLRNYKKDGTLFYNEIKMSPIKDDAGNLTHYVGIHNDVTERIRIQNEIQEINESLEQRVEQRTSELQATLDELRTAQHRMVQSEKLASLGQLIAGVAHEINTPLAAIKAGAENMTDFLPGALSNLPKLLLEMDETERNIFSIMVNTSMLEREEISTRDERALRKKYEDILNDEGVLSSKEIAKKLVTNGIRGDILPFMPLLLSPKCKDIITMAYQLAQIRSNLDIISQAASKTRKTVYALKRYSHFQQDEKIDSIDLVDSLEVILTLYHNQLKHGVEVVREFNQIPAVLGYSDELGQVWTNIIHNAAQAMKFIGTLVIRIDQFDEKTAVVQITDNGPGIPPEIKEKIFEPFFTTKPQGEGSGLGLDIVKKIIEKHEGKIEVDSEPGKTTFSIYLPYEPKTLVQAAMRDTDPEQVYST